MTKVLHFNGLSPAEAERLAYLLEELGEVQQVIGKILRHGYASSHPDGGPTNRELLAAELGDVIAAICLMKYDIPYKVILSTRPGANLYKYLHHQIYNECKEVKP